MYNTEPSTYVKGNKRGRIELWPIPSFPALIANSSLFSGLSSPQLQSAFRRDGGALVLFFLFRESTARNVEAQAAMDIHLLSVGLMIFARKFRAAI